MIVNTKSFFYQVIEYQSKQLGNQIVISFTQETKAQASECYILSIIVYWRYNLTPTLSNLNFL